MANFRANIAQRYLPLPTDVTFEGIVKEYFFNTAGSSSAGGGACRPGELFCPLYSAALSPDPLLGADTEEQVFLAGVDASTAPRRLPLCCRALLPQASSSSCS